MFRDFEKDDVVIRGGRIKEPSEANLLYKVVEVKQDDDRDYAILEVLPHQRIIIPAVLLRHADSETKDKYAAYERLLTRLQGGESMSFEFEQCKGGS